MSRDLRADSRQTIGRLVIGFLAAADPHWGWVDLRLLWERSRNDGFGLSCCGRRTPFIDRG